MARLPSLAGLLGALLLSSACSSSESPDASTFVDAGRRDAGPGIRLDAGAVDAGADADAGVAADAGEARDAAAPDAGLEPDAGATEDAGQIDAAPPDATPADAGPLDASEVDASVEPDAGAEDGGTSPDAGPVDSGVAPDAGPADSGVVPDAGPADSGVVPDAGPAVPAYTIDGDLSDWTNPLSVLVNPGYSGSGLWGADNRFEELRVDGDAHFLYLGFRFRASGNSAIVYMDTVVGGATSAATLDAWPRLVTLPTGADHFVAQYEGGALQLRDVASPTSAPSNPGTYPNVTVSNGAERTTEVAIPWSALGLAAASPRPITFFAVLVGGDNYGGGDMAPNANSAPIASGNTIGDSANSFAITFAEGFVVNLP